MVLRSLLAYPLGSLLRPFGGPDFLRHLVDRHIPSKKLIGSIGVATHQFGGFFGTHAIVRTSVTGPTFEFCNAAYFGDEVPEEDR